MKCLGSPKKETREWDPTDSLRTSELFLGPLRLSCKGQLSGDSGDISLLRQSTWSMPSSGASVTQAKADTFKATYFDHGRPGPARVAPCVVNASRNRYETIQMW